MTRLVDILMSRGAFFAVTFAALCFFAFDIGQSITTVGADLRCWNWPNITVTFALILALYLARQIDARMRTALHELWLQGTLAYGMNPARSLQERILQTRSRREISSALIFMAVMVIAYAPLVPTISAVLMDPAASMASKRSLVLSHVFPILLGVFSGLVAGAFFGRLATYGSMATVLASPDTALNVRPSHFDGANGFKPVGDFYLYQAVLTAIPLVWLAGWAMANPWYYSDRCFVGVAQADIAGIQWRTYGQWLVVACYTYLGFVRPVLALRRRLVGARAELLMSKLPQIEVEIAQLMQTAAASPGRETKNSAEARIHDLAREHWSIRNMTVWPMDGATFRKYAPVEIITKVVPILLGPLFSLAEAKPLEGGAEPSDLLSSVLLFLKRLF